MVEINKYIEQIKVGNTKTIAKAITIVENEIATYETLLQQLEANKKTKVVGITGPPGAGKSTLVNALLHAYTKQQKRIAVVSVDPSSPFNFGALLGDRIRMQDFYLHSNIYIRSIASRGNLGGLSSKIIEIIDVLKASNFDTILVETVGVGQSEVEIASLADTTLVVVVPEAGDEVQTMKAGVMEIADIFVVNKADRPNADSFVKNLKILAHTKANDWEIPVLKCVATEQDGIEAIVKEIENHNTISNSLDKKSMLLYTKAYKLIEEKQMQKINTKALKQDIEIALENNQCNLYQIIKKYI